MYDLKNDENIEIKIADNRAAPIVWDREGYRIEEEKQLGNEEIYDDVFNDAAPLLKIINAVITKIKKWG